MLTEAPPADAQIENWCMLQWRPDVAYVGGATVAVGSTVYWARWWTLGDSPTQYADTDWSVWVRSYSCWPTNSPPPTVVTSVPSRT